MAALRRLDPRDRFASSSTTINRRGRALHARLARGGGGRRPRHPRVEPRGSTDLCGGWLRGCEQVALAQTPGAVTRVLLLTDGLANAGITDPAEIVGHAGELRRRGIATTTIGVGDDFDEHLLGAMADAGGGHFYYVEHDEQIPRRIETEVGEALEVTLREARLRVGPAASRRSRRSRPSRRVAKETTG